MSKGPSTYTPKPHTTCIGCDHFDSQRASSGGLRGPMTYYMDCIHPDAWKDTEGMEGRLNRRSLISGRGQPMTNQRTPSWCPYLNKEENNV